MSGKKRTSIVRKGNPIGIYIPVPLQSPMNIKIFWYIRLWRFVMAPVIKMLPKPDIKVDAPSGVNVVLNEENTADAPALSVALGAESDD